MKLTTKMPEEPVVIHFAAARALSRCGDGWVRDAVRMIQSPNVVARVGAVSALPWCSPDARREAFDGIALAFLDDDFAVKQAARKAVASCRDRGWTIEESLARKANAVAIVRGWR